MTSDEDWKTANDMGTGQDTRKALPPQLVVCGTDTDVGKTVVSALLVQGLGAHYWKPVQSGIEHGGDSGWIQALLAAPGFMQQLNPWTGEFSGATGYSPAMCVFIDFVDRLKLLNSEA